MFSLTRLGGLSLKSSPFRSKITYKQKPSRFTLPRSHVYVLLDVSAPLINTGSIDLSKSVYHPSNEQYWKKNVNSDANRLRLIWFCTRSIENLMNQCVDINRRQRVSIISSIMLFGRSHTLISDSHDPYDSARFITNEYIESLIDFAPWPPLTMNPDNIQIDHTHKIKCLDKILEKMPDEKTIFIMYLNNTTFNGSKDSLDHISQYAKTKSIRLVIVFVNNLLCDLKNTENHIIVSIPFLNTFNVNSCSPDLWLRNKDPKAREEMKIIQKMIFEITRRAICTHCYFP